MLSFEFILVWTLLLGCAITLMQPIWEQNQQWEKTQEKWNVNQKEKQCQTNQLLSENRFVIWKNTCNGLETLAGWDANHYA